MKLGQWRDNANLNRTLNRVRPKTNWVLLRNGRAVSGLRHYYITDARREVMHWVNILRTFPDGSKLALISGDGTYIPLNHRFVKNDLSHRYE